jgi:hypothetical protein
VARRGNSRTIGEVRRSFIEAAVLEQGYQASEVASFLVVTVQLEPCVAKAGKQNLSKNRKSGTAP